MRDYYTLLRTNRNFRMLWCGQLVSQLGDWFNSVAIYALVLDLTGGSATAVAIMMGVQLAPIAIFGPFAGVLVDRWNRRRVMIASDLVRGVVILGLLLVRRPEHVWIAYVLMTASVTATAFFEPARTSTVPGITTGETLIDANALSAATWSAMLAIGAGLGGIVTAIAGRDTAFAVNALSFFMSAAFIAQMQVPVQSPADAPEAARAEPGDLDASPVRAEPPFTELWRYARAHRSIAVLMFVKAGWGIAGGALLLLTIFGERVFPLGSGGAAGIGFLFCARGIGATTGSMLSRVIIGNDPERMRRRLGPAYLVAGAFYVALAVSPSLAVAALAVAGAHAAGSVLWVSSTVLLQIAAPNQLRGRIFATEQALVTTTTALFGLLTALCIDRGGIHPRVMAAVIGGLFAVPALVWMGLHRRR